eukprot:74068-Chlamydomonas_euryale.AAC.4
MEEGSEPRNARCLRRARCGVCRSQHGHAGSGMVRLQWQGWDSQDGAVSLYEPRETRVDGVRGNPTFIKRKIGRETSTCSVTLGLSLTTITPQGVITGNRGNFHTSSHAWPAPFV